MDFKEYLNNIEKVLEASFDIHRDYAFNDIRFDLFAQHNLRRERYILMRKAVIDAMECNEFTFIKYFNDLNKEELQKITQTLIKGIELINFDDGHMSSNITGVLVLDKKPEIDIIETIEKFKYHKSFALGFKGWVDIRVILVTMDEKYIVTNKKGREVHEVYSV